MASAMNNTLYEAIDTDDSDLSSFSSTPFSAAPTVSSFTSYDVSLRSGSPTPSVWSVTSSIRANAYKQEFGRDLNNYSEVYRLPADAEELERLGADLRHFHLFASHPKFCRQPAHYASRNYGEIRSSVGSNHGGRYTRRDEGNIGPWMWKWFLVRAFPVIPSSSY